MTTPRRQIAFAFALAVPTALAAALLLSSALPAAAQKHNRSSPPTAPPAPPIVVPTPLVPISSGLGAIQFVAVNYGVPAPQVLTRQLRFDDDRTRSAALSAIGAPNQYLQRGHIPMPRTVGVELLPLSTTDDLDALLTVELDQHIVTAVLIPVDGNWKRIATLIFPTSYNDTSTTPGTWLSIARAFVQPDRYRAIFHASYGSMGGNFTENEAHLRIFNSRAYVTLSFESTARACTAPAAATTHAPGTHIDAKAGCNLVHRWFQPDPADPTHRFELLTASGHITAKEAADPYANARTYLMAHLRTFSCQPFVYNESSERYEPAAANASCSLK